MQKNHVIVLFDWIGSLLMLSTVWGWIYAKLSPALQHRLKTSERRLQAIERLLWMKYRAHDQIDSGIKVKTSKKKAERDLLALPFYKRYREYQLKTGGTPDMSIIRRSVLMAKHSVAVEDDSAASRISHEEYAAYEQYSKDRNEILRLGLRYGLSSVQNAIRLSLFKIIDGITVSTFRGRVGAVLFLLGLILWNLSKALSLSTP